MCEINFVLIKIHGYAERLTPYYARFLLNRHETCSFSNIGAKQTNKLIDDDGDYLFKTNVLLVWLVSSTVSIELQHHLSSSESAEDSLALQTEVNRVAAMPNGHIKRGH